MRTKLLLLVSCILLAACAEDIQETGITRERAISIAKTSCKEYPDRFPFVDRAQWIPEKKYWAVELADRSGDHGRVYKINRNGEIVGTRNFNNGNRYNGGPYYNGGYYNGGYYNGGYGPGYGPYGGGWWY